MAPDLRLTLKMELDFPYSTPLEMSGASWVRMWSWWVQSKNPEYHISASKISTHWSSNCFFSGRWAAFLWCRCLPKPLLCRRCPSSLRSSTESWGWAIQTWPLTASRRCSMASCLSMFSRKRCSQSTTAGGLKDDPCPSDWGIFYKGKVSFFWK